MTKKAATLENVVAVLNMILDGRIRDEDDYKKAKALLSGAYSVAEEDQE